VLIFFEKRARAMPYKKPSIKYRARSLRPLSLEKSLRKRASSYFKEQEVSLRKKVFEGLQQAKTSVTKALTSFLKRARLFDALVMTHLWM
jgi:hypothetical protein